MKAGRTFYAMAPLVPLLVVGALAVFGVTMSFWFYLLLVIFCPGVAGVLWFIARDAERKIAEAKGDLFNRKG